MSDVGDIRENWRSLGSINPPEGHRLAGVVFCAATFLLLLILSVKRLFNTQAVGVLSKAAARYCALN